MKKLTGKTARGIVTAAAFIAVIALHYLWHGLFPGGDTLQDKWAALPAAETVSWLEAYLKSQSYWLGLSYAISISFAAWAVMWYRESRQCQAKNAAIGGVTLTGVLAALGCYMLGCCGSPMLVVYMNLFGAKFLPLAGPLIVLITLTTVLIARWWLIRKSRAASSCCGANGSD